MIVIFSALEDEVKEFKKQINPKRSLTSNSILFYEGNFDRKDCLLAITGMGKSRAERATLEVFGNYSVSSVISTGFGGALNYKTAGGDVVVYSELVSTTMKNNGRETIHSDPELVSLALRVADKSKIRLLPGKGVSAIKVYDSADSKRRLGERYGADMVDIESYWIGQITGTRKLPFIAIRSVFDAVNDDLKVLEKVTDKGKIVASKALAYGSTHPSKITKLVRYSWNSRRKAAKNLAVLIGEMVKEIR